MYRSSAKLVKYLASRYNIPLDREHIIGHDNIPTISPSRMATQHWDPGPFWDWNHYMALLHDVSDNTERTRELHQDTGTQKTVSFALLFSRNALLFKDCTSGTCVDLPQQSASAVQLRTQPSNTAPLLSDQYVHQDGSAGTNKIDDWGAVAASGQHFAYADQKGDWIAIYYGGQKAWFYNPKSSPVAAITKSSTVVPRVGRQTIPVYGAAYPEASAYPQDGSVPVQTLQPLYQMPAGQAYATTGEIIPTDYYYGPTFDYSMPRDHTVITGYQKYYQITYNHRVAYVLASDVSLKK